MTTNTYARKELDIDGDVILCTYVDGRCVRCEWLTGRDKGLVQTASDFTPVPSSEIEA